MAVKLKPQKLTIFGVSSSGKTCLVGAITKAFCEDNYDRKVVFKRRF